MSAHPHDALLLELLDGSASPAERARAEALLASDAAARARHAELAELFRRLGAVAPAEPPADLRERVLREIRQEPASRAAHPGTARRPLSPSWPAGRVRVFAGLAFAAGLALGVVAMGPGRSGFGSGARHDLSGAMGGAAESSTRPVFARAGASRAEARTTSSDGVCRVLVEVTLEPGAELELSDPAGTRAPLSLRRLGAPSGEARLSAGAIAWRGPAEGTFEAEFSAPADAGPSLTLSLISGTERSMVQVPVRPAPAPPPR